MEYRSNYFEGKLTTNHTKKENFLASVLWLKIFFIAEGALLICLEDNGTKELIDAVVEANPQQFICLDSAFHGNDQLKANAVQTFNARNMQKEKHNQIVFRTV